MLVCFCYKPGGIEAGGKRKKTKKKKKNWVGPKDMAGITRKKIILIQWNGARQNLDLFYPQLLKR